METLTWQQNLLDRASVRIAPWTPGLWPADDVEAVGRLDHLALVGLDGDLAPAVHRGVGDRQHRRRDQGRVVEEEDLALLHGPDQRPVDEGEGAVGVLGVLADQVGGRGVAVAGHRDQVIAEGRLDQRGLPGTGRPLQQGRHAGRAQLAQGLDIGHVGQRAGLVDLPVRAGDRAGRSRLGGKAGLGAGEGRRRRGRPAGGGGRLGRKGGLGRDGGGCGGGGGVGLVADRLAGYEVGLAPVGEGGQRVADRAGRPGRGPWRSRLSCRVRGGRRGTRLPGGAAGRCRAGPSGRRRGRRGRSSGLPP